MNSPSIPPTGLVVSEAKPHRSDARSDNRVHTFFVTATADQVEAARDAAVTIRTRSDGPPADDTIFGGDHAVLVAVDRAEFIDEVRDCEPGHVYLGLS
ncbi:hypothetical protein [Amycolatopsis sp. NPDC004079]|uniref:hypothetical protein n=1 Tax=Amycolatopsis sp. NPDC004079 TaxID=3154549 RepID=UPI0033B13D69